jgi:hypothetical protein
LLQNNKPWIKVNSAQKAFLRVALADDQIRRLLHAPLKSNIDRAGLLLDAYALAKARIDGSSFEIVIEIIKFFYETDEHEYIVWMVITEVLTDLWVFMEQLPSASSAFNKFVSFGNALTVRIFIMLDGRPNRTILILINCYDRLLLDC